MSGMFPSSLTITSALPRRSLRTTSEVEIFEGRWGGQPIRLHRRVAPLASRPRTFRRLETRQALRAPGVLSVPGWSEDGEDPLWLAVECPVGLELAEWVEACVTSPRYADAPLATHAIAHMARGVDELRQRGLDLPGHLVVDAWILPDRTVWLGACGALADGDAPSEAHQTRHLLELLRHLAGPRRPRAIDLLAIEVGEHPTLAGLADALAELVARMPSLELGPEGAEPLRNAVAAGPPARSPRRPAPEEEGTPTELVLEEGTPTERSPEEGTRPARWRYGHDPRAPDVSLDLAAVDESTLTQAVVGGRYRLLRPIGSGAMGHVYEATRLADGGQVAVKVMKSSGEGPAGQEYVARFRREAKLLARLDHPNIVKVEAFGTRGGCWIAMELVRGHSLVDLLDSGEPLPLHLALSITRQVAEALAHAHARGIVHRDIKPGNLLVAAHDPVQIKLCDFGLAKAFDDEEQTMQGALIGTPQYMSPEQARGEPAWARADLYGVGILLYRLVTGRTPFADQPPVSVLLAHSTTDPLPMAEANPTVEVPAIVQEVVDRCLAKVVDERYGGAEYLVDDLQRCLDRIATPHVPTPALTFNYREPTTEEPTGNVRMMPPSEPPRRLAGVGLGIVVALALAAAGMAVWWWSAASVPPPPAVAPGTPASEDR